MKRLLAALLIWLSPVSAFEVYLVRHGQTDWNVEEKLQGKSDVPLNNEGRSQAMELARILRSIDFSACYSSDLQRTKETAEILLNGRTISIETDFRWRERDCGAWEGKPRREYVLASPEEKLDVESTDSLLSRTLEALYEIKDRHLDDTVMVVTHGGVISALLKNLVKTKKKVRLENASYVKLNYANGSWKLNRAQGVRAKR